MTIFFDPFTPISIKIFLNYTFQFVFRITYCIEDETTQASCSASSSVDVGDPASQTVRRQKFNIIIGVHKT